MDLLLLLLGLTTLTALSWSVAALVDRQRRRSDALPLPTQPRHQPW